MMVKSGLDFFYFEILLKPSQNHMSKKISRCTKNGVYFDSSVTKNTIFGAARKFFGPSYFVTALAHFHHVVPACSRSKDQ